MSRLPQPGDAVKASALLNERMGAATGVSGPGEWAYTGPITVTPEGISGPGVESLRRVYGDLFDVTELLDDAGWLALCDQHREDVEAGTSDALSANVALALQAVGFGVLMERKRWERER